MSAALNSMRFILSRLRDSIGPGNISPPPKSSSRTDTDTESDTESETEAPELNSILDTKDGASSSEMLKQRILQHRYFCNISAINLLAFTKEIDETKQGPFVDEITESLNPLKSYKFFFRCDRRFGTDFILTFFSYEYPNTKNPLNLFKNGQFQFNTNSNQIFIKLSGSHFHTYGMIKSEAGKFAGMLYLATYTSLKNLIKEEMDRANKRAEMLRPQFSRVFLHQLMSSKPNKTTLLQHVQKQHPKIDKLYLLEKEKLRANKARAK